VGLADAALEVDDGEAARSGALLEHRRDALRGWPVIGRLRGSGRAKRTAHPFLRRGPRW
jgi:hypothetical protein